MTQNIFNMEDCEDSAEDKDVTQRRIVRDSGCPVVEAQQLSNGGSSQVPVLSLSSIFAL